MFRSRFAPPGSFRFTPEDLQEVEREEGQNHLLEGMPEKIVGPATDSPARKVQKACLFWGCSKPRKGSKWCIRHCEEYARVRDAVRGIPIDA